MNALTANFAFLTQTLAKFTAEPLAQDFFDWCSEAGDYPHIRWTLSVHNVRFEPSMRLADFKAVIQRREEREIRLGEERSRHFDSNRLVTWRQILRAIDKYQEIAR